jgi:hypothetical protein
LSASDAGISSSLSAGLSRARHRENVGALV